MHAVSIYWHKSCVFLGSMNPYGFLWRPYKEINLMDSLPFDKVASCLYNKQNGTLDCGLFAYAIEIFIGNNPREMV